MRRFVPVQAVVAAALLTAGCGRGSGGGAAATVPGPHTSARAHTRTLTVTARNNRPHRGHAAGVVSSATPGAATTARSPGAHPRSRPAPAGAMSSASDGGVPLVAAGDYTYRARGHAETALGNRDFAGRSHLTVTAPSADRRHTTLRGKDGTTEQTLVGRDDGLYLADVKMSQQGFDADFRPAAAVLLYPTNAREGDKWSWQMTSTDGDYTLHATLRPADDSGSAMVSGRRVPTVTVKGTLVLEGKDFSMTLHQQDVAAAGGLVVHEHSVGDGTAYGTPVHTEADRRLVSG